MKASVLEILMLAIFASQACERSSNHDGRTSIANQSDSGDLAEIQQPTVAEVKALFESTGLTESTEITKKFANGSVSGVVKSVNSPSKGYVVLESAELKPAASLQGDAEAASITFQNFMVPCLDSCRSVKVGDSYTVDVKNAGIFASSDPDNLNLIEQGGKGGRRNRGGCRCFRPQRPQPPTSPPAQPNGSGGTSCSALNGTAKDTLGNPRNDGKCVNNCTGTQPMCDCFLVPCDSIKCEISGQTRYTDGVCYCPSGQESVNGGACEPKCATGQTRNAAGKCECPACNVLVLGICQSTCSATEKCDESSRSCTPIDPNAIKCDLMQCLMPRTVIDIEGKPIHQCTSFCKDGNTCVAGACVPPPTPTPLVCDPMQCLSTVTLEDNFGSKTTVCQSNCTGSNTCVAGVCVPPPTPTPFFCDPMQCLSTVTIEDNFDSKTTVCQSRCAGSNTCVAGVCVPPGTSNGP